MFGWIWDPDGFCEPGTSKCERLTVPTPLVSISQNEKINASIGIFYSPKFKMATHLEVYMDYYCYDIGDASINVFDHVFHQTFERTLRLADKKVFQQDEMKLNGVIEVQGHSLDLDSSSVSITYRFLISSTEGRMISSFFVTGKALDSIADSKRGTFEYRQRNRETISKAIKNAAENFRPTFLEQKGVQRWLELDK
jgi:hypothetical protein